MEFRVERSRIVTDGSGRWKDQWRRLLLFRREEECGCTRGMHEAVHIWTPNEKKAAWLQLWSPGVPQRAIYHLALSPSGSMFPADCPASRRGGFDQGCFFVFAFFEMKPSREIKKQDRDSRRTQINSRQAAFGLWARWCRMLTRRLSSHPGTEGVT